MNPKYFGCNQLLITRLNIHTYLFIDLSLFRTSLKELHNKRHNNVNTREHRDMGETQCADKNFTFPRMFFGKSS